MLARVCGHQSDVLYCLSYEFIFGNASMLLARSSELRTGGEASISGCLLYSVCTKCVSFPILVKVFWWQSLRSRRDMCFTLQCFQGTTLLSNVFFVSLQTNLGHTGGGEHWGLLLDYGVFLFLQCPTTSSRIFLRVLWREGFSRPFPRR